MAWKWDKPWMATYLALELLNIFDLEPYGLEPVIVTGLFYKPDLLIPVAAQNPHLHIVSAFFHPGKGPLFINRYCEGAGAYYLAKGLTDPTIELQTDYMTPEERREFGRHLFEKAAQNPCSEDAPLLMAGGDVLTRNCKQEKELRQPSTREENKKRRPRRTRAS